MTPIAGGGNGREGGGWLSSRLRLTSSRRYLTNVAHEQMIATTASVNMIRVGSISENPAQIQSTVELATSRVIRISQLTARGRQMRTNRWKRQVKGEKLALHTPDPEKPTGEAFQLLVVLSA